MDKRILTIIILALLAGGILSSLFLTSLDNGGIPAAYAAGGSNFFQNFVDRYLKPLLPGGEKPGVVSPTSSPAVSSVVTSAPVIPYAPTIDYEQAVVRAVESAQPAVVSIIISKNVPIIEQCPYDPFADLPPEYKQFFGQPFEFYQPCEKGTRRQEVGGGSGFIISSDGLIVTNKHVVLDEKADYTVFTNDGKKYEARVLARDPARDLAIIKIEGSRLPVLKLGDSDALKLGQTAIAIGNALGEFRNTVSVGVISGLSRSIVASGGGITERIEGLIQTDAAINQGNSGGPLLNLKGEVVGINVATVSGAQNIGFTIPINQVKRAIESVKRTGEIKIPYIGIRYILVTPELVEDEKLSVSAGALVRGSNDGPAVVANSPAAKAGLRAEDIITEINGEQITLENSLALIIQKYNVGDVINLKIIRGGKAMILNVTLEQRPKNL